MILTSKYIFIHVDKAGGTSIQRGLEPRLFLTQYVSNPIVYLRLIANEKTPRNQRGSKHMDHLKFVDLEELIGCESLERRFRFCFVRNPWTRELSLYHHTRRSSAHKYHSIVKDMSFSDYVRWAVRSGARQRQTDLILDHRENLKMDFIGRFERLQEDFDKVKVKIGRAKATLPKKNLGDYNRNDWQENYDQDTKRLVGEYYARDIELLQYNFDDC